MIIELSDDALEDIGSIKDHIKRDSEYYANNFIDKIFDYIQQLEDFPKLGRIMPELNDENIRDLIFNHYRIIYQIKENTGTIIILNVVHGSRLLNKEQL